MITLTMNPGEQLGQAVACLLIVDDNVQIGSSLVILFQRHGFIAASVRDGRSALDYMLKQRVDIVITDIFMPDGDGLELMRELHRWDIKPRVIAMTAGEQAGEVDVLHVASLMGATHTIQKPFDPGMFLQLVREVSGEIQAGRAAG